MSSAHKTKRASRATVERKHKEHLRAGLEAEGHALTGRWTKSWWGGNGWTIKCKLCGHWFNWDGKPGSRVTSASPPVCIPAAPF